MDFLKKFSFAGIIARLGQSLRRFPIAMLLVVALTCFLIYYNHGGDLGPKRNFFFIFYPATGALLAVALSLLTEDFKRWRVSVLVQAFIHATWLAISIYLSRLDRFSLPQTIAVVATVFAIGISIFLICFYRKSHDVQFWNFSIRTLMGLAVAVAIGGILTLGLYALMESLKMLFDVSISNLVYPDIAILCMVALAPVLFMNIIPAGEDKYQTSAPEFSRFAKGVVQYLFLPLLGTYIITLYAYAVKILYQWSLPVGGVSYLVSGSMVLMVLLIYVTYPIQHLEGNKLFKRVARWLPVAMLPLLALMTVAIVRRLSDYGITLSRLYLLVFNLWCYAVCLWLIFTRNKRIWPVPASFAIILFLISVGPQSIANVTQRQLKKEARAAFTASGIRHFPITGEQYEQWLKQAAPKMAKTIDSKLDYLNTDFGFRSVSDLLAKDVILGRESALDEKGQIISNTPSNYANDDLILNVPVPSGYATMTIVRGTDDDIVKRDGDKIVIKVEDNNDVEHEFEMDVKQLAGFDDERNPDGVDRPLLLEGSEALLVINSFRITVFHSSVHYMSFSGILFTK